MKEIHSKDVQALYLENEEQIEEIRQKYEKHRGMVEIIKKVEESSRYLKLLAATVFNHP